MRTVACSQQERQASAQAGTMASPVSTDLGRQKRTATEQEGDQRGKGGWTAKSMRAEAFAEGAQGYRGQEAEG